MSLQKALPGATIITPYVNTQHFKAAQHTDLRGGIKLPVRLPKFLIKLIATIYYSLIRVSGADVIIHSGTMSLLAAKTNGFHIFYCHKPPLVSANQGVNFWPRRLLLSVLRIIIKRKLSTFDLILSNSDFTAERLYEQTGLSSRVLQPCIDQTQLDKVKEAKSATNPFFVSPSRHAKHKNVDKIIRAFIRMPDYKLIICSSGEETRKLRYLAKKFPNITFTGHLGKEKYFEIIKSSLAVIYVPTNEDFGISALEALGLGVPLIHTCSGGLNEICNNQVTIQVDDDDIENQLFEIISNRKTMDWAKQKQVSSSVINHEFQSFITSLKILLKEELGINV